jgi:hypothetical protein
MRIVRQGERTCEQSSIARRLVAENGRGKGIGRDTVEINQHIHTKGSSPCLLVGIFSVWKSWDACDVCLGTCVSA